MNLEIITIFRKLSQAVNFIRLTSLEVAQVVIITVKLLIVSIIFAANESDIIDLLTNWHEAEPRQNCVEFADTFYNRSTQS